ncbi:polymorphic toxin type 47 domain-containing protein [Fluviicola sp.]|uniref:polymorphic toxin type 47 domain-containing protein n=1 Tax=Fluviicola sp. TaxID=1917219 RepID=UPI0031E47EDC
MKEDADADVDKGKNHDSKAKALMMARVITEANDKVDTPIPALLAELAPLKAIKGVKGFDADRVGPGIFQIIMFGSEYKVKKYEQGTGEGLTANEDDWEFDASKDLDWRGKGATHLDALDEAFERTGVPKEKFKETQWAKNKHGKTIPVEWEGPNGENVNMDIPEWNNTEKIRDGKKITLEYGSGPHQPHIGYKNSLKGKDKKR